MAQKHNEEMISAPMTRYGRLTLEAQRRQLRSDAFTAAEWAANNPILQLGELGSEKDTNKIKVGNGITKWNDLPYSGGSEAQIIQVEELPEATADELGNIYQFVGTTDANYTNGYFYKCTGAGEPVVYSWSQVDVQPAPEALPDQTGQNGKFLTTDGTDASWSDKPLVNKTTKSDSYSLVIQGQGSANTEPRDGSSILIGNSISGATLSGGTNNPTLAIGNNINCGKYSVGVYLMPQGGIAGDGIMISKKSAANSSGKACGILLSTGNNARIGATTGTQKGLSSILITSADGSSLNANNTTFINCGKNSQTITEDNTFWWANSVDNYKIVNADGTIPAARHATLPAADGTYVLKLTISGGVPTLSWVAE